MFLPVPRHTDKFKEMMKTRSTSERVNKRVFVDYDVERCHSRSAMMRFSWAVIAAVNVHLDAWIRHLSFDLMGELRKTA